MMKNKTKSRSMQAQKHDRSMLEKCAWLVCCPKAGAEKRIDGNLGRKGRTRNEKEKNRGGGITGTGRRCDDGEERKEGLKFHESVGEKGIETYRYLATTLFAGTTFIVEIGDRD